MVGDETGDPDGDGLDNLAEQAAGTDPNDLDTDGDLVPDGLDPEPLNPLIPAPPVPTLGLGETLLLGVLFVAAGLRFSRRRIA